MSKFGLYSDKPVAIPFENHLEGLEEQNFNYNFHHIRKIKVYSVRTKNYFVYHLFSFLKI
jgi:hypothetical protein